MNVLQTQITHDFKFDVFRAMHSGRYFFGLDIFPTISHEASQMLLESVTQFMNEHREIVWPKANIAWLHASNRQRHAITKPVPRKQLRQVAHGKEAGHLNVRDHRQMTFSAALVDVEVTRDSQVPGSSCDHVVAAWLNRIFEQCLKAQHMQCHRETPFEIGSLHTLRSPEYIKFFNHLNSLGEFCYNHISDVPIRLIGATLFVPERCVWLLPDTDCKVGEYCAPELNLDQVSFLASVNGNEVFGWDENCVRFVKYNLILRAQRWNIILEDFRRQEGVPSPALGHTLLDERNFEPFYEWHFKIYLFREWVRKWNSIYLDQELEPLKPENPHATDVPAKSRSLLSVMEEKFIKPRINTYRIYGDELA